MPSGVITYDTGAASDPGKVRAANEDRCLAVPASGLWAVADGMGGHEAGALAAQTVVETLATIGAPASAPDLLARFEDRILKANGRVREIARARGGVTMGSTVAALLIHEAHFAAVWCGDSRIYRVREGTIAQISRDHTEAQDLVDKGLLTPEEAKTWPRRNVITRAIGVGDEPELEFEHGAVQTGDVYILCSDGLTGHVADGEIGARADSGDAQRICDALVALTLDRGAEDNVTVVAVRCVDGGTVALASAERS
jgi:serine/threonine protein phosphatase PrpC